MGPSKIERNTKPGRVTLRLKDSARQPRLLVLHPLPNSLGSDHLKCSAISTTLRNNWTPHWSETRKPFRLSLFYNAILELHFVSHCHFCLILPIILHIYYNKQLPSYHLARHTGGFGYATASYHWIAIGVRPEYQNSNISRMVGSNLGEDRLHIRWVGSRHLPDWGLWWEAGVWWDWGCSTHITLWDNPRSRYW